MDQEQYKQKLEEQYNLVLELWDRLEKAHILETDVQVRLKLEVRLKEVRGILSGKMEEIENAKKQSSGGTKALNLEEIDDQLVNIKRDLNAIDKTEFVNRETVLEKLTNKATSTQILVDAPAGFGKTFLLQKAREWYDKNGWLSAYVKLKEIEGDSETISDVIEELGRQLVKIENLQEVSDLANQIVAFSNNDGAKSVVLLFDSFDKTSKFAKDVRNNVIPRLSDLVRRVKRHVKIRVIFAGRWVKETAGFSGAWSGYEIHRLLPFNDIAIKDLIVKFANNRGIPLAEDIDYFVNGLLLYSGGHPKIIAILLDYIIVKENWMVDWNEQRHKKYILALVKKQLKAILMGVHNIENLESCIRELSIFRKFNPNTLDEFTNGNAENFPCLVSLSSDNRDAFKCFQLFTQTGIYREPAYNENFYSDSITRKLMLLEILLEDKTLYRKRNIEAIRIFDKWISTKKELSDDPLVECMVESIYHFFEAYAFDKIEESRVVEVVGTKFNQLRTLWIGNKKRLCESLKSKLLADPEIRYRLQEANYYQNFEKIVTGIAKRCDETMNR